MPPFSQKCGLLKLLLLQTLQRVTSDVCHLAHVQVYLQGTVPHVKLLGQKTVLDLVPEAMEPHVWAPLLAEHQGLRAVWGFPAGAWSRHWLWARHRPPREFLWVPAAAEHQPGGAPMVSPRGASGSVSGRRRRQRLPGTRPPRCCHRRPQDETQCGPDLALGSEPPLTVCPALCSWCE